MTSLKDALEGKPLRSPLHPALVHLPLGLLPLSLLLDLASWIWPHPELYLAAAASVALGAGIATALVAAVFGFVDFTEIRHDHEARKPATLHMVLNLVAVGLFTLSLGLRWNAWDATRTPALPLLTSLLGLAVMAYAGYLGGHLVYADGIAVGRHRRRRRLPQTTLIVKDEPGRMVMIGSESSLPPGATLRVDANGIVITVARAGERLYAFQEFCTHRFGPMSEGEITGCEVVCPWHRSRFDLRTGEVTSGPAKVPLRTFSVETRDGKIWLRIPEPSDPTQRDGNPQAEGRS